MFCILPKPVVLAQKPNGNTGTAGNQHDYKSDQETPDLRTMVFLALAREPRFAETVSNESRRNGGHTKLTFRSFHVPVVGLVPHLDG